MLACLRLEDRHEFFWVEFVSRFLEAVRHRRCQADCNGRDFQNFLRRRDCWNLTNFLCLFGIFNSSYRLNRDFLGLHTSFIQKLLGEANLRFPDSST